ncbi:hypothetical protein H8356DRAFT_1641868 [Neocallimastix lanati (nom. inval.)]|jgi:uncharacterized protein YdeI (YjbR/CyaY-like superfamily)|uniref:Uncharacterized protein n=1 Tax=Neocallimastix californiae TaxID=1754190 RepID=A0A1Y2B2I4_9FUNG|nr:hypothetical protein H8356DRAFT_1641868 [Neocallimastix sp. JGI-2020a]ORY29048.1 hypothetical protein LY90DRAFT_705597 [Neocallimastix californiae]|eukprot:ORY29048.1 hypothetical protein LY90DRAFT_705597 [Neocallimastix californiae]
MKKTEKKKKEIEKTKKDIETFYTSDRKKWRRWLSKNFEKKKEIWFVFPLKKSGEEILPYNDAVEEALCFGWIDSTIKYIDPLHRAQRFTPRRIGSSYSRLNIERLIWLDEQDMIHPKIRESVVDIMKKEYKFPKDILDEIKADEEAWKHYQNFSDSYKRIRISYIDAARKYPDKFNKRLASFINKTKKGKILKGYGGTEKYYK